MRLLRNCVLKPSRETPLQLNSFVRTVKNIVWELGVMVLRAYMPPSAREALRLKRRSIRLAAEQGSADAQFSLGVMYTNGRGVPQDYVRAHKWLNLATSRASAEMNKRFGAARDRVGEKMTSAQIAEAQRLAREWKPKTWDELKDK